MRTNHTIIFPHFNRVTAANKGIISGNHPSSKADKQTLSQLGFELSGVHRCQEKYKNIQITNMNMSDDCSLLFSYYANSATYAQDPSIWFKGGLPLSGAVRTEIIYQAAIKFKATE